jgi:hypothetical protein
MTTGYLPVILEIKVQALIWRLFIEPRIVEGTNPGPGGPTSAEGKGLFTAWCRQMSRFTSHVKPPFSCGGMRHCFVFQ